MNAGRVFIVPRISASDNGSSRYFRKPAAADTRPLQLPDDEADKITRGEVAQNVEELHRPLEGPGKTGGTDNRLLV
jgi:hypothetical protein